MQQSCQFMATHRHALHSVQALHPNFRCVLEDVGLCIGGSGTEGVMLLVNGTSTAFVRDAITCLTGCVDPEAIETVHSMQTSRNRTLICLRTKRGSGAYVLLRELYTTIDRRVVMRDNVIVSGCTNTAMHAALDTLVPCEYSHSDDVVWNISEFAKSDFKPANAVSTHDEYVDAPPPDYTMHAAPSCCGNLTNSYRRMLMWATNAYYGDGESSDDAQNEPLNYVF